MEVKVAERYRASETRRKLPRLVYTSCETGAVNKDPFR